MSHAAGGHDILIYKLFSGLMLQLSQAEVHECEPGRMEQILNRGEGEEGCKPRLTVIRLPDPQDQFSHVTPSHIEVNTGDTRDTRDVTYLDAITLLVSLILIPL